MNFNGLKEKSLQIKKGTIIKSSYGSTTDEIAVDVGNNIMAYNFKDGVLSFTEYGNILYVAKRTDESIELLEGEGFTKDEDLMVPFTPYTLKFECPGYIPGMFD